MNEIKHNTTSQTWHDIADENNLWVKWRFEVLKKSMKLIGISFKENCKCLDVGCGNNNFALNLEKISNYTIDQIDVDPLNFINKKKGRGDLFEYNINNKRDIWIF